MAYKKKKNKLGYKVYYHKIGDYGNGLSQEI